MLLPSDQQLLSQLPAPPPSCQPTRSLPRTDHKTASFLNILLERWLRPKQHSQRLPCSTVSLSRHSRLFSQFLSRNSGYHSRRLPYWPQQEREEDFRSDFFRIKDCALSRKLHFWARANYIERHLFIILSVVIFVLVNVECRFMYCSSSPFSSSSWRNYFCVKFLLVTWQMQIKEQSNEPCHSSNNLSGVTYMRHRQSN